MPHREQSHEQRAIQIALRTYILGLSFSTAPALLPIVASYVTSFRKPRSSSRTFTNVLRRELGPTGLPFAMAVAAGGGSWLTSLDLWYIGRKREGREPKSSLRVFLCNLISCAAAITLLHSRRRSTRLATPRLPLTFPLELGGRSPTNRASPTLDLTLLLLVRALDAVVGNIFQKEEEGDQSSDAALSRIRRLLDGRRAQLDALLFWLSCSRIMWCFFYEPECLPKSYIKWISSLAEVDPRISEALRALRSGTWNYGRQSVMHPTLLSSLSAELGYPSSWGKPELLPAFGGVDAKKTFKELGITSRGTVGGLPCEIVHGSAGGVTCSSNASIRGFRAFCKALIIYMPVYLLPPLFLHPKKLLRSPVTTIVALLRSASFLATFVASFWTAVCFTRTLAVARLLPKISHNYWDGPLGCILAGSVVCGSSVFVERPRRRAEVALYVLPRAIRASLKDTWIRGSNPGVKMVERAIFAISLAYLLTVSNRAPEYLRGLSRWTLAFVMRGPNVKFTNKGVKFYKTAPEHHNRRELSLV